MSEQEADRDLGHQSVSDSNQHTPLLHEDDPQAPESDHFGSSFPTPTLRHSVARKPILSLGSSKTHSFQLSPQTDSSVYSRPYSESLQSSFGLEPSASNRPDSEGLQLAFDSEWRRRVTRDSEGLQSVSAHSRGVSDGSATLYADGTDGPDQEKEVIHVGEDHDKEAVVVPQPSRGFALLPIFASKRNADRGQATAVPPAPARKRRWWLFVGVAIALVVIVAAVLGGVLGSRAVKVRNASSAQNSVSAPSVNNSDPQSTARIQGRGTWNGTGITTFYDARTTELAYVCFQDFTGAIYIAPFTLSNDTHELSLNRVTSTNITAANGTGLAGYTWSKPSTPGAVSLQLVYVTPDGHLADAWQENAPSGAWTDGDLSQHQLPAPIDNRPAMETLYDFYGGRNNSAGLKLFAGGTDGAMHEYSYDAMSHTWYPWATHNFTDSSAYGGVSAYSAAPPQSQTGPHGNPSYTTTLFLSNKEGNVQSYVQANGADGDVPVWPNGGSWTSPISSNQRIMANSSFEMLINNTRPANENISSINHDWIMMPGTDGKLASMEVDQSFRDDDGHFGSIDSPSADPRKVMQGTDFDSVKMLEGDFYVLFYQETGDSIAWVVVDGAGHDVKKSGHISLDSTSQWVIS